TPAPDTPAPETPAPETPASETPAAADQPQGASPAPVKDSTATPATLHATPAARTIDGAQPPFHGAAAPNPTPSAAPAQSVDARQPECDFRRPPYPRLARLNGESGTTLIRLTLAADGQITTAVVERSSGFSALDAAALASARAGRCSPGASARLATVPFHFQLDP
ncbi:MAG: TonB family protein, partial [Halothiobacillaceae bacterium]